MDRPVRWTAQTVDTEFSKLGCRWDLTPPETKQLLNFLSDVSAKKWKEVWSAGSGTGHRMHHHQDGTSIHKLAQERLIELGHSDEESLYRFRIQGTVRLWGFRTGDVFRILWYDPDHQVSPTTKRNT